MVAMPTDPAEKRQLWNQTQQLLPGIASLINTLKDQGITCTVAYINTGVEEYYNPDDARPDPNSCWQVDDALMERVGLEQKKVDFIRIEKERKERLRIDAAKRKRGGR